MPSRSRSIPIRSTEPQRAHIKVRRSIGPAGSTASAIGSSPTGTEASGASALIEKIQADCPADGKKLLAIGRERQGACLPRLESNRRLRFRDRPLTGKYKSGRRSRINEARWHQGVRSRRIITSAATRRRNTECRDERRAPPAACGHIHRVPPGHESIQSRQSTNACAPARATCAAVRRVAKLPRTGAAVMNRTTTSTASNASGCPVQLAIVALFQ